MWSQYPKSLSVFAAVLVVASDQAIAAQSVTWMPTSWFGEAAVVALAFALPALAAGAYLLAKRIWRDMRSHPGLSLGAAGIVMAAILALLSLESPGAARMFGIGG